MPEQPKTSIGKLVLIVLFACIFSGVFVYFWAILSIEGTGSNTSPKQILIWMFVAMLALPQGIIVRNYIKKMLNNYSADQLQIYDSQKKSSDKLWLLFLYVIFAGGIFTIFGPAKNSLYFASLYDYAQSLYKPWAIGISVAIVFISIPVLSIAAASVVDICRKLTGQKPVGLAEGQKPLSPKEAILSMSLNIFVMMFCLGWLIMIFLRYGKYI